MYYHNEHTHFCREMCNFVNTRFLRPYGVITEITTKSPQKLYNGSSFSPHFTQKSSFYPLKSFLPQVLKIRFHLWKHCEWPTVANTTVYLLEMDLTSLETDFILPEMDFTSRETDFTSPETDFTFFIFEVHFRWVKSIFNGYLQMDLTFSKHSIFDRLHPSEVY